MQTRNVKTVQMALVAAIALLVAILFNFLGNTADIHMFGRSSITWMIRRWADYGGRYSHCYLIPVVSLSIIWWKRKSLAQATKKTDIRGLILIILCLLLQIVSARTRLPRLSLVSLIGLTWCIPYYLYGWQVARILIFPCAYLMFCIPLTFLDTFTFPLRLFASSVATHFLNGLGIEVARSGTAIHSLSADGFGLDVADPCSGLRYFLVMMSLTAAYGYMTQKTLIKKWVLFVAAAPLAVAANIVRIVTVAIVAEAAGQDVAAGVYHNWSGYIVFVTAVTLMIGLGGLLNVGYRKRWQEWKRRNLSRIL